MIFRFLGKNNNDDYVPTTETQHQKQQLISGINSNIEILGTAGKSEYPSSSDTQVNLVNGVLLTYLIDNRQSFEAVKDNYRIIKKLKERIVKLYSQVIEMIQKVKEK